MAFHYSPLIPHSGLIHLLEPTRFGGTSSESFTNKPPGSTWGLYNFSNGTSANFTTLQSNAASDGSGTSYVAISRNSELETGSITAIIWMNLEGIALNVGGNNNWRGLLCTSNSGTAGSPLTMVQEQSYVINFSTSHTDGYRRFLNNSFAPVTSNSNGWQMVTYTYDQASGQAACYKDTTQVRTGPMTTNGSNGSPTSAGTAMSYSNYASGGFRIYGGTNTSANPNGNGICPGEMGHVLFYNRAITSDEVTQIFESYREKYGI